MQLHAVAGRLRTVGGGGEWATGADDDDDHEDACVAETWRGAAARKSGQNVHTNCMGKASRGAA